MEQLADALIQGLDQQAYVAIDGDTLTREDFVESNTLFEETYIGI
jgi:hypothetical protein